MINMFGFNENIMVELPDIFCGIEEEEGEGESNFNEDDPQKNTSEGVTSKVDGAKSKQDATTSNKNNVINLDPDIDGDVIDITNDDDDFQIDESESNSNEDSSSKLKDDVEVFSPDTEATSSTPVQCEIEYESDIDDGLKIDYKQLCPVKIHKDTLKTLEDQYIMMERDANDEISNGNFSKEDILIFTIQWLELQSDVRKSKGQILLQRKQTEYREIWRRISKNFTKIGSNYSPETLSEMWFELYEKMKKKVLTENRKPRSECAESELIFLKHFQNIINNSEVNNSSSSIVLIDKENDSKSMPVDSVAEQSNKRRYEYKEGEDEVPSKLFVKNSPKSFKDSDSDVRATVTPEEGVTLYEPAYKSREETPKQHFNDTSGQLFDENEFIDVEEYDLKKKIDSSLDSNTIIRSEVKLMELDEFFPVQNFTSGTNEDHNLVKLFQVSPQLSESFDCTEDESCVSPIESDLPFKNITNSHKSNDLMQPSILFGPCVPNRNHRTRHQNVPYSPAMNFMNDKATDAQLAMNSQPSLLYKFLKPPYFSIHQKTHSPNLAPSSAISCEPSNYNNSLLYNDHSSTQSIHNAFQQSNKMNEINYLPSNMVLPTHANSNAIFPQYSPVPYFSSFEDLERSIFYFIGNLDKMFRGSSRDYSTCTRISIAPNINDSAPGISAMSLTDFTHALYEIVNCARTIHQVLHTSTHFTALQKQKLLNYKKKISWYSEMCRSLISQKRVKIIDTQNSRAPNDLNMLLSQKNSFIKELNSQINAYNRSIEKSNNFIATKSMLPTQPLSINVSPKILNQLKKAKEKKPRKPRKTQVNVVHCAIPILPVTPSGEGLVKATNSSNIELAHPQSISKIEKNNSKILPSVNTKKNNVAPVFEIKILPFNESDLQQSSKRHIPVKPFPTTPSLKAAPKDSKVKDVIMPNVWNNDTIIKEVDKESNKSMPSLD